ncbi:MAG: DivIVA domain-containing protein [Clostridia bacterium]|nr:DivIVA domain-containing protein [Clostridia bacterium]
MTSKDIKAIEFRTKFGGYNAQEVDAFIENVAKAMEALETENSQLKFRVDQLTEEASVAQELEKTLRDTMVNAQLSANQIIDDAKLTAMKIESDAQTDAENLRLQAQGALAQAQVQADEIVNQGKVVAKNALANVYELRKLIGEYKSKITACMNEQLDVMEKYFADIEADE